MRERENSRRGKLKKNGGIACDNSPQPTDTSSELETLQKRYDNARELWDNSQGQGQVARFTFR